MATLMKKRGGLRATVTAILNKATPMLQGNVAVEHDKLRLWYKQIQHNLSRLYEQDTEVVNALTDVTAIENEVSTTEAYNEYVLEVMLKMEEVLMTPSTQTPPVDVNAQSSASTRMTPSSATMIKLPKFEMAVYNGDPLGWQAFWDIYKATIHDNPALSSIEKFSYLLGYLSDEAYAMASGYSLTEANYSQVIGALQERFGDKQRAQFAHFRALIAIDPVKSGSLDELRRVSDQCEMHIRSLVALGLEEKTFAIVFIPIIMSKIPVYLTTKLCEKTGKDQWSLANVREWIKADISAREMGTTSFGSGKSQGNKNNNDFRQQGAGRSNTTTSSLPAPGAGGDKKSQFQAKANGSKKCVFCSRFGHKSHACRTISDINERIAFLKQNYPRTCWWCFKPHAVNACEVRDRPCSICQKTGHASILCRTRHNSGTSGAKSKQDKQESGKTPAATGKGATATPGNTSATVAVAQNKSFPEVDVAFLQTAVVTAKPESGDRSTRGRALMDGASSRTYVTEDFCRRLGLQNIGSTYISVGRFGTNKRTTKEVKRVRFVVVCNDGSLQPVLANVTDVISCPVSRYPIDPEQCPVVKELCLAEPLNTVQDSLEIDILIGSDQYFNFVATAGTIRCNSGLVFIPSRIGYLTAGTMPIEAVEDGMPESTLCLLRPDTQYELVHQDVCDLEKFWQLEDVGAKETKTSSVTDEEALRQFQETVQEKDGRYYVTWPWKTKEPNLPHNFGLAYGRLQSTFNRLLQDEKLMKEYNEVIQKQYEKGIIEKAPQKPDGLVYYVPHHPVIDPQRATTKVRVVYDASSKARKNVPSLNDCLLRGPVIMDDLCGLLMRIRMHKIALISDIEKAFLQVRLQPQERDATRFLWVKDPSKPPTGKNVETYRFTSVFFGSIASPFLLAATVDTHLRRSNSDVAKKIRESLYVDNVITGEETETDTINHYLEAKSLFLGASMNLREFYTNSTVVRNALAPEDRGTSKDPKILGIRWDVENDTLRCGGLRSNPRQSKSKSLHLIQEDGRVTKRLIASQIAKVYDPCGWFCPVIVEGKLLIQELWKHELAWDDEVPPSIAERWQKIRKELDKLHEMYIPRYIGCSDAESYELHAFCDASTLSMGVSVYLRKVSKDGTVSCDLVFAKTRLAPLKPPQTIPRLELVGLVMATNMIEFVESQLRLPLSGKVVWCDAQCVLFWLTKEKLGTKFVERRIHEIRSKQDITFRFVPGTDNPADIPTRGCSVDELRDSHIWWHGPAWLISQPEEWPKSHTSALPVEVEESQLVAAEIATPTAVMDPQRFSCLFRLLRVTAYVFRFVQNIRTKERRTTVLRVGEISAAWRYWERLAQSQGYPHLQQRLNTVLLRRSSVAQLNVFRDKDGLLRCRGRFANSELSEDAQEPILLPKVHPFTVHVIRHTHENCGHAGVAQTLHTLRQRYWIPQGRSRVKQVIRQCRICRRVEGGPYEIPHAPALPNFRVVAQEPFATTGLDYLGFLTVKLSPTQTQKVWVCLFTCAVTRAIHLELVENQAADEFHLALRRFAATYGCPRLIVSDNGSQFSAVESAMNKLWSKLTNSTEIEDWATTKLIQWKKIPQVSPWMGGFYERLVGVVKKFLKKTLNGLCVNLSELRTVLVEITAIVNSRPMLYVDNEVNTLQLTPADLLGKPRLSPLPSLGDTTVTEPTAHNAVDIVVSRWKRLQKVTSLFWEQWRQAYLTSLREKHANAAQRNSSLLKPTIGSVVQIKDKLPRAQWRLGKVEKLIPSADGKIRVVQLRLSNGRFIVRPLKLLYPLEMHTEKQDPEAENQSDQIKPFDSDIEIFNDSEEEFSGFDVEDVDEAMQRLEGYEVAEKMLTATTPPRQTRERSRPLRDKAAKARLKIRQQMTSSHVPREGSDEEC